MRAHEFTDPTQTPAFKAWFRDSKVVDASGKPIIVYHGTSKNFRAFNSKKSIMGIFWFTSDKSAIEAGQVGAAGKGHIFDLYASIQNPAGWAEYDRLGMWELERQFDGVILPDRNGHFTGFVWNPAQLKSASKNNGNFDLHNKNLREADEEFDIMDGPDTLRYINDHDADFFKSKRIEYFIADEAASEKHIVARAGDRIIGMAGMQQNPYDPEQIWIKFVSVDARFRGIGLGRALLERVFQYAVQNGQKVAPGGFTEEGRRLAHLHDEFEEKYPRASFDRNEQGDYINSKGQIIRRAISDEEYGF